MSENRITIPGPSSTFCPTRGAQCNVIFRGTLYPVRLAFAVSRSSRLQAAQFAIPTLPSFSIPYDFPLEGHFHPIAEFLNGADLTFALEDRLFTWSMAVYLEIGSIIPDLSDYMFDCIEQSSFLRLLEWLFHAHCDVTLPVNMLQGTVGMSAFLSNPFFEKLDPDLIDLFLAGTGVEANPFFMAKGGRLIRRLNLSALSAEELGALIRNPAVDLNLLRTGLAELIRSRSGGGPASAASGNEGSSGKQALSD
jgi:hypothetical protein